MPGFLQNTQAVSPVAQETTFLPADTTVAKAIVTAPGGPWHLFEITVTSDDTAARVIDIFVRSGSTNFLLGSISIPAGSGLAGVVPVAFVAFAIPSTLVGLDFPGAISLQAAMETTITAAKTVTVSAWYASY